LIDLCTTYQMWNFKCDSLVQINFEGALRKSVHVLLELLKLNLARISHEIFERGKELSDGRCIGDLLGNFTCFNTQGQSTMDYLITNVRLLSQLLYFKVSDFLPLHSDCHCKISIKTGEITK
jgi:hypothetical protein